MSTLDVAQPQSVPQADAAEKRRVRWGWIVAWISYLGCGLSRGFCILAMQFQRRPQE